MPDQDRGGIWNREAELARAIREGGIDWRGFAEAMENLATAFRRLGERLAETLKPFQQMAEKLERDEKLFEQEEDHEAARSDDGAV